MKLNLKSFVATSAAAAIMLGGLVFTSGNEIVGTAKAQDFRTMHRCCTTRCDRFHCWKQCRNDCRRNVVIIVVGRRCIGHRFIRHRHHRCIPFRLAGSRIILVNRNTGGTFVLRNSFTGPGSTNINTVRFNVDNQTFNRVINDVDVTNNVSIVANTGNNTVSFNTGVGSIRTGDVNIDVSQ